MTAADVTQTVERRLRAEQAQDLAERRYADAQAVVRTMQAALLPDTVPVVPGLDLAAHYLVAAEDTDAGGDWFDVFDRADGDVLLVVGDVVGHGAVAAAVMGQLRAVLRERLLAGVGVGVALQELDRFAGTVEGGTSATVCVVRWRPGRRWSSTARQVMLRRWWWLPTAMPATSRPPAPGRSGPGAGSRPPRRRWPWATWWCSTPTGSSSGRVVYPRRTPSSCSRCAATSCSIAGSLTKRRLVRPSGCASRRSSTSCDAPADPASVPAVRRVLATWVGAFDPREADAAALQLAVNELVANAVVHGYSRDGTGTVGVSARVDHGGVVHAEVVDQGGWVDRAEDPGDGSEPSEGGRGLVLVQAVTDDFVLEHAERGTAAWFSMQLRRSVELVDTGRWSVPSPRRRSSDRFEVEVRDDVVVLRGAIDLVSAPRMEAVLREESLGGSRHTVVDLDGVTLLTSSAVSVLDRAARSGRVRLQESPGTPAQHVLDLVALPHDTPAGDGRTGV